MNLKTTTPEFATGEPVESQDLLFRDAFIDQTWELLERRHMLMTAPRRTGKTSVMKHLVDHPRHGFSVVYLNVQDLEHPADFFQAILDNFYDKHPALIRDLAKGGWSLLKHAVKSLRQSVDSLEVGEFKMALRHSDPDWKENWRKHGEDMLTEIRRLNRRVLFIVDELPDMILNMGEHEKPLTREFLAWFRTQRLNVQSSADVVRWLVGGSVNLASTLDQLGEVDLINDFSVESLPVLTEAEVQEFVKLMLGGRGVTFKPTLPKRVVTRLGRPIPLFLQLVTQSLYRSWKTKPRVLSPSDVDKVFDELVTGTAAQDKLQHYHSRLKQYYREPLYSAAHVILGKVSQSGPEGLSRRALEQEFAQTLEQLSLRFDAPQQKREFNHLMRNLENDFYLNEISDGHFDFASGVMKAWWKKYYA